MAMQTTSNETNIWIQQPIIRAHERVVNATMKFEEMIMTVDMRNQMSKIYTIHTPWLV